MQFDEIIKDTNYSDSNKPNLLDYKKQYEDFDWYRDAFSKLDWLPDGGLNNAYECVDRHVKNGFGDKLALVWLGKNGEEENYTYKDFKEQSDKFGQVMINLGMEKGDRVFIFMDRLPELYFAAMGILKAGGVIAPLFSAFGPDPVKDRMLDAGAAYLVTSPDLRKKISPIIKDIKTLKEIIVVNKDNRFEDPLVDNDLDYEALMKDVSADSFKLVNTSQYDFSIMHYTSGSTGKPKGVLHRHQAVVQQMLTGHWALELSHGDIYFCTADPGWVTGTSYGMIAPWTNGVTQIIYEGGFSASSWYEIIQKYKVDVWYTAPTAIRLLMRSGEDVVNKYDLTSLKFIGSVGEPLNPEAVVWGERNYKLPIHDNWWQTETGAIMCANYSSTNIKPGSMGRPFPGITMGILDDQYNEIENILHISNEMIDWMPYSRNTIDNSIVMLRQRKDRPFFQEFQPDAPPAYQSFEPTIYRTDRINLRGMEPGIYTNELVELAKRFSKSFSDAMDMDTQVVSCVKNFWSRKPRQMRKRENDAKGRTYEFVFHFMDSVFEKQQLIHCWRNNRLRHI